MPLSPTNKKQLGAYRFLIRRQQHAVAYRSVDMVTDPLRFQRRSMVVGVGIGAVLVLAAFVLAFLKPQDVIGSSHIVIEKSTGEMFVLRSGRLHPVPNLASARLVLEKPENPKIVKDEEIRRFPRGMSVGIEGAPSRLPGNAGQLPEEGLSWQICDRIMHGPDDIKELDSTTLAVLPSLQVNEAKNLRELEATNGQIGKGSQSAKTENQKDHQGQEGILVRQGDNTWLLSSAGRARINLLPSVKAALNITDEVPRPVSNALLDILPELAPITNPTIPDRGTYVTWAEGRFRIGDQLVVKGVSKQQLFVVLSEGVQEITPLFSELLSQTGDSDVAMVEVAASELTDVRRLTSKNGGLPTDGLPAQVPRWVDNATIICSGWSVTAGHKPVSSVWAGEHVPGAEYAEPTLGADASGDHIDRVIIKPGTALLVRPTSMTQETLIPGGESPESEDKRDSERRPEELPGSRVKPDEAQGDDGSDTDVGTDTTRWLISDGGVRFGIDSDAAVKALGIGVDAMPAPWSIIRLFTQGPTLSIAAARRSTLGGEGQE